MDVWRLEDFILPIFEPSTLGGAVTFWAMPVATRVVRLLLVATLVALDEVAAEGSGATQLDGP